MWSEELGGMQDEPGPLFKAINHLTTLMSLHLDLYHPEGQVVQQNPAAYKLRLPQLREVIMTMAPEVGRVDARACPLLDYAGWNRVPHSAMTASAHWLPTFFPWGLAPLNEEQEEALHAAWRENAGPYPACPEDGIVFGTKGHWQYGGRDHTSRACRGIKAAWEWSPVSALAKPMVAGC